MSPAEKIKQLFAKSNVTVDPEVDDRTISDALAVLGKSETAKSTSSEPKIWRIIIDNKIFKIAAGIILIGIIAIGIKFLGGSNAVTGVAFGEVLRKIRNSSYTFDVTIMDKGRSDGPVELMILEPGILRWDSPEALGGISLIIDFTTTDLLLLYHQQKIAAKEIQDADIEDMSEEPNPLAMFIGPVENLWNLQDGTEKSLGEKEIDGQPAVGFEVQQDHKDFSSDIIVWAHKETGNPILVELTLYHPEDRSKFTTITASNFNLDAELDEELFSLEPPEGYTLAYQKELENTTTTAESTPEAEKIQRSIELWNSGEQEKSIEMMLSIDWTQPFEFLDEMYLFSMTHKGLMQLKQEDQQKIFKELSDTLLQLRGICRKLRDIARTAISESDYEKAELCLETILELGRLISGDHESIPIARIAGLMLQQNSLKEMASLYSQTNNQEKLQQVQDEIKRVEAAIKSFRRV